MVKRYAIPGQTVRPKPVAAIEARKAKAAARREAKATAPPEATEDDLRQLATDLEELEKRQRFNRMLYFKPYVKQQLFFDMGSYLRERLLMAGNQLGKSEAGAFETMCHLTGIYPDDWMGKRFDKPTRGWAAGESSTVVRDVQQNKLCGKPGVEDDWGTGMVPKHLLIDKSLARGVTDAYDTIQVRHVTGGVSTLTFKSYEQGRTKFQGEPVDFIWCDEEPPMDVYSECLTRTTATKGIIYVTFTPLKGMSDVVIRYLNEKSDDRGVVTMVIEDAEHIPAEERAKIIAGYPAHEREARARGVPLLGSGRIFTIMEDTITEPAIEVVPPHWYKLWAIDFGIDHPFAAVLLLWDKDADVVHVHHCIRVTDQLPLQHAVPMKQVARAVPVAWPQDGHQRDKGSGDALSKSYKDQGLAMLPHHSTFEDGSNSTEAGIVRMSDRFTTGRLKVASHLSDWFEEYRMYHRKDGLIVKLRDDLLSATRVGIMSLRFARQVPLGSQAMNRRKQSMARDVDYDLFGG